MQANKNYNQICREKAQRKRMENIKEKIENLRIGSIVECYFPENVIGDKHEVFVCNTCMEIQEEQFSSDRPKKSGCIYTKARPAVVVGKKYGNFLLLQITSQPPKNKKIDERKLICNKLNPNANLHKTSYINWWNICSVHWIQIEGFCGELGAKFGNEIVNLIKNVELCLFSNNFS
jgi:hypothetical protein